MRVRGAWLLSSGLSALVAIGCAVAAPSESAFEIGEPFPELVLPSVEDGHPMSIAEFRGKKILLHVFASW
jgi:hypothetical protein